MTQLTNFGENKFADFFRGQGMPLPTNWHIAPGSAASDSSFTEITGIGLARFAMPRSLANWAGTQGPGTTLASTGTSHASSNNIAINFGTPTGTATLTHVGFFDAASGGNCWIWLPLATAIAIISGSPDPVQITAGDLSFTLGITGGCSDDLANKLIDKIWRGEPYDWPATVYQALYSMAPTNAGGGVELSVTGYARKALVPSLASMSGTQAAGSTSASNGTGGRMGNNANLAFAAAFTAIAVAGGLFDAATAGNLLLWGLVLDGAGAPTAKSLSSAGAAPSIAANKLGITVA